MLTRMAPILAVAYCTIVHSAQFGAQMPTRSPFSMPSAIKSPCDEVDLGIELAVGPSPIAGDVDECLGIGVRRDRAFEVLSDRLLEDRNVGRTRVV